MSGIIEDEIIGSQSDDESIVDKDIDASMDEVFSMFDIDKEENEEKSVNDKTPAIEDVKTEIKPEPKIEKVKHNKEEVDVDISTTEKLHDHLQRSLALDKERERREKNESLLKEAATLLGLESLDEATIQRVRQERQQQQQEQEKNAYNELRKGLREEAIDAGLDPDKLEAYLDNHPVMKEAQRAIQERDASKVDSVARNFQDGVKSQWNEVFTAFPDIEKRGISFNGTQVVIDGDVAPDWLTPDMLSRLHSGYKPIDAFRLAHMDKLQTQTKTKTQQRMIKEQHLGLRSQVETNAAAGNETAVPDALANAFEMFGLPKESAKKYMKK